MMKQLEGTPLNQLKSEYAALNLFKDEDLVKDIKLVVPESILHVMNNVISDYICIVDAPKNKYGLHITCLCDFIVAYEHLRKSNKKFSILNVRGIGKVKAYKILNILCDLSLAHMYIPEPDLIRIMPISANIGQDPKLRDILNTIVDNYFDAVIHGYSDYCKSVTTLHCKECGGLIDYNEDYSKLVCRGCGKELKIQEYSDYCKSLTQAMEKETH